MESNNSPFGKIDFSNPKEKIDLKKNSSTPVSLKKPSDKKESAPVPVSEPQPVQQIPVQPEPQPVQQIPVQPEPQPVKQIPVQPEPQPVKQIPVQPEPQPVQQIPVQSEPNPEPVPNPVPNQSKNGVLLVIIAVLLVGVGITSGMLLSTNKNQDNVNTNPNVIYVTPTDQIHSPVDNQNDFHETPMETSILPPETEPTTTKIPETEPATTKTPETEPPTTKSPKTEPATTKSHEIEIPKKSLFQYGIVNTVKDPLNMRSEPDMDAEIIYKVPLGAGVEILDESGNFYYANYTQYGENGISINGYLSKDYILESIEIKSLCPIKGQINCHNMGIASFTTNYVALGGSKTIIRKSLGDKWHVTAKNMCKSHDVTWYELWDSDDGDYYGWVDENYIDFY